MGHLVDYEGAQGPMNQALAALEVVERKSANARAWYWGRVAAGHAEEAGVSDAYDLLGDGRRPEVEPLRQALMGLVAAEVDEPTGETVSWLEAGEINVTHLQRAGFFDGLSPGELAFQEESERIVRAALEAGKPYVLLIAPGQMAYHYALVGVDGYLVPLPIVLRWFDPSVNTVWFGDEDVVRIIGYKWAHEADTSGPFYYAPLKSYRPWLLGRRPIWVSTRGLEVLGYKELGGPEHLEAMEDREEGFHLEDGSGLSVRDLQEIHLVNELGSGRFGRLIAKLVSLLFFR